MSRGYSKQGGFGARESAQQSAAAAAGVPSAKDEKYLLTNRLQRMKENQRSLKRWLTMSEMMGAGKKDIASAKETLEAYNLTLEQAPKIAEAVKNGDLSAIMPSDNDTQNSEGAKIVAAQMLRKEKVEYGPNLNNLSKEDLEALLKVGSKEEHRLVFDKNGKFMYGTKGKDDNVDGSWPEEASPSPRGYTNYQGQDFHTHPVEGKAGRVFGGPPSPEDLQSFITSGMTKRTIVAPEGHYILEMSDGIRGGISGTGKDRVGVTNIAGNFQTNAEIAWNNAQRASGPKWENDKAAFKTFLSKLGSEFKKATQEQIGLRFVPNKGYEDLALDAKAKH